MAECQVIPQHAGQPQRRLGKMNPRYEAAKAVLHLPLQICKLKSCTREGRLRRSGSDARSTVVPVRQRRARAIVAGLIFRAPFSTAPTRMAGGVPCSVF